MREIPVAEFKRNFHHYVAEVLAGRPVRVTRHGRPVGDFVPPARGATASSLPVADRPGGLVALAGLFSDWTGMDQDIADIVDSRRRAGSRRAPPLD